jgi:peptidoglycan/xylan/chitin deacetylase (PgdA/CDA1 family)
MLRSICKTSLAYAYTWTGARRLLRRQARARIPFIACYHRVVENFERSANGVHPPMLISTRMLERQIDWLAKRFALMSLDEIASYFQAGRPFDKKRPAAITFDDGYRDVYDHAFPLLKRKGIPAAFFVVTDLVGTSQPQFFDRFYLLLRLLHQRGLPLALTIEQALRATGPRAAAEVRLLETEEDPFAVMTAFLEAFPRHQLEEVISRLENGLALEKSLLGELLPLSWDMIETLSRSGMTIGSHTKSHPLLTNENAQTVSRELDESKQILEARLKTRIKHFAYPDGRFNSDVVQAVGKAGYDFGYSICHVRDRQTPVLTIPRKVLWERSCLNAFGVFSSAVMGCQTQWLFDPRNRCEHNHSVSQGEQRHGIIAAT